LETTNSTDLITEVFLCDGAQQKLLKTQADDLWRGRPSTQTRSTVMQKHPKHDFESTDQLVVAKSLVVSPSKRKSPQILEQKG